MNFADGVAACFSLEFDGLGILGILGIRFCYLLLFKKQPLLGGGNTLKSYAAICYGCCYLCYLKNGIDLQPWRHFSLFWNFNSPRGYISFLR